MMDIILRGAEITALTSRVKEAVTAGKLANFHQQVVLNYAGNLEIQALGTLNVQNQIVAYKIFVFKKPNNGWVIQLDPIQALPKHLKIQINSEVQAAIDAGTI